MKKFFIGMAAFALLAVGALTFAPEVSANAIEEACQSNPDSALCNNSDAGSFEDIIRTVINVLLTVVGIIAVIMIIISGLRMVISSGEAKAVASAKNGILYSVIGLVVAILAFAIVNFVLDTF